MIMRHWTEAPRPWPPGVARAWVARDGGRAACGIFELVAGGVFMLTYHVAGERAPRVEQFDGFQPAQERANRVLSESAPIPRRL